MIHTNVCVIGAGPAGTVASLFLSKNKIPHLLIDRAIFPREKVCGEVYDGRLQHVLNKIDTTIVQQMKEKNIIQDIFQYAYINSESKKFTIDTPVNTTARISTNRFEFDNFLLQQSLKSEFVQYFDNTNVTQENVTANGVLLSNATKSFEVLAQTVILATGSNSTLAHKLVPKNKSMGHFLLAARGYYRNIAKQDQQNIGQFFFFRQPVPFYMYIVHLPNNLATVEVCILKNVAVKHRLNPESLLLSVIKEHPEVRKIFINATLEGKINGAVLPKSSWRQAISNERVMLAGSCGSSINPVTGWGVGHAAYEAMCAVNQYVVSCKNNNFSAKAFKDYDKKVHKALGKERLIGRMVDLTLLYGYASLDFGIGCIAKNAWLSRKAGAFITSV